MKMKTRYQQNNLFNDSSFQKNKKGSLLRAAC
jgi:hypothetical protein